MTSTGPPFDEPDTQPLPAIGSRERKRAALVLGLLAIAAVLLVGIMSYVLGSSRNSPPGKTAANPGGPAVTVTGGAPATSHTTAPVSTTQAAPLTRHSTPPRHRPVSCPTAAPCALPDDVGHVVSALNAYRAAHHEPPVTGSVTAAAQRCALANGDTSACPAGYYWQPVGRSGTQVIQKIAASGGRGTSWLTDPRMRSVQVGWAYLPSSKSFECVVVSDA